MREILRYFCFGRDWIEWVMNMVSLTFYSILLNGSPTRTLNPTRGIRQGDPLSPFLFIIMAKCLSWLIQAQSPNGEIKVLNIHKGMDKQTH